MENIFCTEIAGVTQQLWNRSATIFLNLPQENE